MDRLNEPEPGCAVDWLRNGHRVSAGRRAGQNGPKMTQNGPFCPARRTGFWHYCGRFWLPSRTRPVKNFGIFHDF